MRLIDAEALLDYLDDDPPYNWTGSDAEIQAVADWEQFRGIINVQPTITDVAPVVHGRWIEKSAPARKIYFECSQCGAQENKHTAIKGYYCWRCGAKMDGGDNDAAD